MKWIKRVLMLSIMIFALMLTGCGSDPVTAGLDTTLTVSTSFSGERVMHFTLPRTVYKKVFNNDSKTAADYFADHAPVEIKAFAQDGEDGGVSIELHLTFSSLEDYQAKIAAIFESYNDEDSIVPQISFDYARTILKKGYTIEENFTSKDLLRWVDDAIRSESGITVEGDLFSLADTEVIFNGMTAVVPDGRVSISDIESKTFDYITVSVGISDEEGFSTEVKYAISNKVVVDLGEELDELMVGLTPANADLTYESEGSQRVYTLSFNSGNQQSLLQALNKALQTEDNVFEVNEEGDAESLSASKTIVMYLNGSYFLDFTKEDTYMAYIVELPDRYSLDQCKDTYGYMENQHVQYASNTCRITTRLKAPDQISILLGFAVDIDSVSIRTHVEGETKYSRDIIFRMSQSAASLIGDSIQQRLENAAKQCPDPDAILISREEVLDNVTYTVTCKTMSQSELTEVTRLLLGENSEDNQDSESANTYSLLTGSMSKPNPWTINYKVEDTISLTSFLRGSMVTGGISYTMNYPMGFKASYAENNTNENQTVDGRNVSCTTYNTVLTVSTIASRPNILGILITIIAGVSLIIVLIMSLFEFNIFIRIMKNSLTAEEGEDMFRKKNLRKIIVGCVALVCLVFMAIRLLFRIY